MTNMLNLVNILIVASVVLAAFGLRKKDLRRVTWSVILLGSALLLWRLAAYAVPSGNIPLVR